MISLVDWPELKLVDTEDLFNDIWHAFVHIALFDWLQ